MNLNEEKIFEMFVRARQAAQISYVPYSISQKGCALWINDESRYILASAIDNSAYPSSVCIIRSALVLSLYQRVYGKITAIAIYEELAENETYTHREKCNECASLVKDLEIPSQYIFWNCTSSKLGAIGMKENFYYIKQCNETFYTISRPLLSCVPEDYSFSLLNKVHIPQEIYKLQKDLYVPDDVNADEIEQLCNEALEASFKAVVTKKNDFPVGACILTTNGNLIKGANIMINPFSQGVCAEVVAILNLFSNLNTITSKKQSSIPPIIKYVAVVCRKAIDQFSLCCGQCRQIINEFSNKHTRIIALRVNKKEDNQYDVDYKIFCLKELLPEAFCLRN